MDLNIFVSKKGTKVVLATELHQALQLSDHHYATNVKRWLNDFYEFVDGIRKPVKMQEFAHRKVGEAMLWQDYYLSVALAKQIVLRSRSKVKQKYALQLSSISDEENEQLSPQQFKHLVDITKAMTLISCQEECERRHLRRYRERNDGSAANWWQYRAEILGYSSDTLREKLRRRGLSPEEHNSQRSMLAQLNPLELIRAGVIDLFMAIGRPEEYAVNMGDLAQQLAETMDLKLLDDHRKIDLFTEAVDPVLVHQLKEPLNKHLVAA